MVPVPQTDLRGGTQLILQKWLANERVARGLRQATAAQELEISASELSLYAMRRRMPSAERKARIEAYTLGKVRADRDWPPVEKKVAQ